jgi:hypothetical protein
MLKKDLQFLYIVHRQPQASAFERDMPRDSEFCAGSGGAGGVVRKNDTPPRRSGVPEPRTGLPVLRPDVSGIRPETTARRGPLRRRGHVYKKIFDAMKQ